MDEIAAEISSHTLLHHASSPIDILHVFNTFLRSLGASATMRTKCLMFIFAILAFFPASATEPEREVPQSVGLVLSGGGAKGIAHIGIIAALEENGIPIDYISGTSMGAIIGALYAMGYTPEEMLDLILSQDFSYWSTGQIDPRLVYYFSKTAPTPAIMTIPVNKAGSASSGSVLPSSLISPLPMNFAFMDLFSAYTAQCDGNFDKLMVPFRCVASDMTLQEKKVWRSGDLGDAVRTSMSFPIVFEPLVIDGHIMYDGGIFDNFPVDVMQSDFDPNFIIGVDFISSAKPSKKSNDIVNQLESLIMRKNDTRFPSRHGITLHVDVGNFGLLDFPMAKEIYSLGYQKAVSMMDSIKSRVSVRRQPELVTLRRDIFKSGTPYLKFDRNKVSVSGGKSTENEFIHYLFTSNLNVEADTFGVDHARESYYRAVSPGRLSNLLPTASYNDSTGLFDLHLQATVKSNIKLGIGGYITSSTSSFLYLDASYSTVSLRSASASISTWLGQSYLAADINTNMRLATSTPSAIGFEAVVSRQKYYENDYLFYEIKVPTFINNLEAFGRFSYSLASGRSSKASLSAGGGYLYDTFYQSNTVSDYKSGHDKAHYYLGQIRGSFDYNTLDNESMPNTGSRLEAVAMAVAGKSDYHSVVSGHSSTNKQVRWMQFELRTANYFSGRHFGVGLLSDIMLSTRKLNTDYYASIVQAPAFVPSATCYNSFNPAFRANSFIGISVTPFWKMNDSFSIRFNASGFMPLRKIMNVQGNETAQYGKWFSNPSFFGELSAAYVLPFATLRGYVNYLSYPARNWNCGLSLGLFFLAPKFLR